MSLANLLIVSCQITALTLPLTETKLFKPAKVSKIPTSNAPAPKKRAGKAKAKAQPATERDTPATGVITEIEMPDGHMRTAWLVDDILNAVYAAVDGSESIDHDAVDKALLLSLEWAFAGKVTVSSGKVRG